MYDLQSLSNSLASWSVGQPKYRIFSKEMVPFFTKYSLSDYLKHDSVVAYLCMVVLLLLDAYAMSWLYLVLMENVIYLLMWYVFFLQFFSVTLSIITSFVILNDVKYLEHFAFYY